MIEHRVRVKPIEIYGRVVEFIGSRVKEANGSEQLSPRLPSELHDLVDHAEPVLTRDERVEAV